ncbi:hypothetical protein [Halomarina oriensis]|uniref:Uncharacterized protein n=1 Tax=Halomarina oriensis TaxID=671145 RepID=A0A6B0GPA1_9EURY|nr:hypothetical protein [Halomarina oriensis]MWG36530.1 hypothetical protein [Halomarina oriensis]
MSKYAVPEGHWDEDTGDDAGDDEPVYVDTHFLTINDERDSIERYNGLQYDFVLEDGVIVGIHQSHYCPGPGHTDPMGYVAWGELPRTVRLTALDALHERSPRHCVDVEACAEAAGGEW